MAEAKIPPHFLVVVPGFMASQLRDRATHTLVWGNFPDRLASPFQPDTATDDFFQRLADLQ